MELKVEFDPINAQCEEIIRDIEGRKSMRVVAKRRTSDSSIGDLADLLGVDPFDYALPVGDTRTIFDDVISVKNSIPCEQSVRREEDLKEYDDIMRETKQCTHINDRRFTTKYIPSIPYTPAFRKVAFEKYASYKLLKSQIEFKPRDTISISKEHKIHVETMRDHTKIINGSEKGDIHNPTMLDSKDAINLNGKDQAMDGKSYQTPSSMARVADAQLQSLGVKLLLGKVITID
ncbi:unnamed protein product [Owenia fusiformis]|uniref:Uncharacterized protein n=1 Tax=Owenia fusiformis TaxID=6347 RepID=A0A8S4NQJ4_OWEFU|nr:unnamed protein product [Owenia fusiformis]